MEYKKWEKRLFFMGDLTSKEVMIQYSQSNYSNIFKSDSSQLPLLLGCYK